MTEPAWDLPKDLDAASWEQMADIVPRHYVCHFVEDAPRIDGKLDKALWREAPWSEPFTDIEGDRRPAPRQQTRMAMRWDDTCLYIAARLDETHVWGSLTKPNSVIFRDNDFEVFIDPDGDHHRYWEMEVNALNTRWQLALEKPYRDGGPPVSPAPIAGLRSAIYVEGTLNAPHDTDTYWSVEIAIPWRGLAPYAPNGGAPPEEGAQWRMNFSRVQWQHEIHEGVYRKKPDTPEDNWVWSPQGVVDMHRPERWGFVQFTRARPGETAFRPDPTFPAREALMAVYYAQRAFFKTHRRWATSLKDLPDSPAENIRLTSRDEGWIAEMPAETADGSPCTVRVDQVSRMTVERGVTHA